MNCIIKTSYQCEIVRYKKRCSGSAYCLFRKRFWENEEFVYKNLYVCEYHAKNRDRVNDTYIRQSQKPQSGETSPYWDHQNRNGLEDEELKANPDSLSEESLNIYKNEEMCFENEELVNKIKKNFGALSFREGQILNLLCYKGMSQAEIARFLNVKPPVIYNTIKRIQKKMRKLR